MPRHALSRPGGVNPAEGAKQVVVDFQLQALGGLKGKVLDPQGHPLAGAAWAGSEGGDFLMPRLRSDAFFVEKYRPERPRRLLFCHLQRKLAGSIILQGPQKEPITVRLQPQGVLTGRVVDAVGKPLAGLSLVPPTMLAHHDSTNFAALPLPRGELSYTTDKDGRFRIEGLAPGVKYNVEVEPSPATGGGLGQVIFDVAVKSGETKDLGDLRVRQRGSTPPVDF